MVIAKLYKSIKYPKLDKSKVKCTLCTELILWLKIDSQMLRYGKLTTNNQTNKLLDWWTVTNQS